MSVVARLGNQGVTTRNRILGSTENATGALNVTGISAPGAVNLNIAGGVTVAASGTQNAIVSSGAGQTIAAQSLTVSAQESALRVDLDYIVRSTGQAVSAQFSRQV